MAKANEDILGIEGHIGKLTKYKRNGKWYWRVSKNSKKPHRLSRKQLAVRQRQSHNNALWRALSATKQVYIERGNNTVYSHFMSLNTESPIPYIPKNQYHSGNALLLPNMVLSDGPLQPIRYQLGEVDDPSSANASNAIPALLTDLTKNEATKSMLLLYVLEQHVITRQYWPDQFFITIEVVPVTTNQDIEIPHVGTVRFVNVPSTLLTPYQSPSGTLALVGDLFANPKLGFGLVRIIDGHASSQRVVTRCTYYERYTTEEALQAAAKSYKGLTGE